MQPIRKKKQSRVFKRLCRDEHHIGRLKVLLSFLDVRDTCLPARPCRLRRASLRFSHDIELACFLCRGMVLNAGELFAPR